MSKSIMYRFVLIIMVMVFGCAVEGQSGDHAVVSRIDMVVLLSRQVRSQDALVTGRGVLPYNDTKRLSRKQKKALARYGAVSGKQGGAHSGRFMPHDPITRAQAIVMMDRWARHYQSGITVYADDIADDRQLPWASESIRRMVALGVVSLERVEGKAYSFPRRQVTLGEARQWVRVLADRLASVKEDTRASSPKKMLEESVGSVEAQPERAQNPVSFVKKVSGHVPRGHVRGVLGWQFQHNPAYRTDREITMYQGENGYENNDEADAKVGTDHMEDSLQKSTTTGQQDLSQDGGIRGFDVDYQFLGMPFYLSFGYGYQTSVESRSFDEFVPDLMRENGIIFTRILGVIDMGLFQDDRYWAEVDDYQIDLWLTKRQHQFAMGLRRYHHGNPNQAVYPSLYYGMGILPIAAELSGQVMIAPKQVIEEGLGDPLFLAQNLPTNIAPIIKRFHYRQTSIGVYADLGVQLIVAPFHVGAQVRFMENPLDLQVDAYGNKQLNRTRASVTTMFAGIVF